jgi:hypothetical protein
VTVKGRKNEKHNSNADACSYSSRLVRQTAISAYQLATTILQKNVKKKRVDRFLSMIKRGKKEKRKRKKRS